MIADTPQIDAPIERRLVSFGRRLNARPSAVMTAIDAASSTTTHARLTPPSRAMSPSTNRTPSSTIPLFSQNSYVSMPASQIAGTPTVFETMSPKTIAHSTYSMFGSVSRWALPYAAIVCSVNLPA